MTYVRGCCERGALRLQDSNLTNPSGIEPPFLAPADAQAFIAQNPRYMRGLCCLKRMMRVRYSSGSVTMADSPVSPQIAL